MKALIIILLLLASMAAHGADYVWQTNFQHTASGDFVWAFAYDWGQQFPDQSGEAKYLMLLGNPTAINGWNNPKQNAFDNAMNAILTGAVHVSITNLKTNVKGQLTSKGITVQVIEQADPATFSTDLALIIVPDGVDLVERVRDFGYAVLGE